MMQRDMAKGWIGSGDKLPGVRHSGSASFNLAIRRLKVLITASQTFKANNYSGKFHMIVVVVMSRNIWSACQNGPPRLTNTHSQALTLALELTKAVALSLRLSIVLAIAIALVVAIARVIFICNNCTRGGGPF